MYTDQGNFWLFFPRYRKDLQEFQSFTSSDKEQEGIEEKSKFFQE